MPDLRRLTTEMIVVVVLMLATVMIALWLGGDRVIPCGDRQGLDVLLGDQAGHVDGPFGGGGCIVPTAAAWTAAIGGALVVMVVWFGSIFMRVRRTAAARSSTEA